MNKKSLFQKTNLPVIIFAVALVVILPLRTWQMFKITEGGSGFFTVNGIQGTILYILFAVFCAAIIAVSFINRKSYVLTDNDGNDKGSGIIAALTAVSLIVDALMSLNFVLDLNLSFIRMPQFSNSLLSKPEICNKIITAQMLFALASAVYFILYSKDVFSGKSCAGKHRILSLCPVGWSIIRIVYRFTITISYLRVAQLTIEMFMLVFFILFFMNYAQVNSKISSDGLDWKLSAYGLPAVLFALTSYFPQIIALFTKRADLLYSYSVPYGCDPVAAIFILSVVLIRLGVKAEKGQETDTKAEDAETGIEASAENAVPDENGEESQGTGTDA